MRASLEVCFGFLIYGKNTQLSSTYLSSFSHLFVVWIFFFFNLGISEFLNSNYGRIIAYWKHDTGSENSPNTNHTIFEEVTCFHILQDA